MCVPPYGIVVHPDAVLGPNCFLSPHCAGGVGKPLGAPNIGRNVNIGAGACILGGIHVGSNAQIGANAGVIVDVPTDATAVGVPARIIEAPKATHAC